MIHSLDNISVTNLSQPVRLGEASSLLYRKQVAYVGRYGQHNHATGKLIGEPVVITKADIDHWAQSIKEQNADGVSIPMQKTHNPDTDPDQTYGYVVDAETGPDEKGRYSLFFICEFGDSEKAKVAPVADCSIYQPPRYANGVGKSYTRPVRHLMLTTASTIPGMGKFIALSLLPESPKMNVFLKQLAISLGIVVPDDATDATISQLILVAWSGLSTKVTALTTQLTEQAELTSALKASSVALALPPVVVTTQQNMRRARLDAMVVGQQITPAMRDSLVATFAKPSGVIALSLNEAQTEVSDEVFDGVVLALSLLPSSDITGRKMGNNGDPKEIDSKSKGSIADFVRETVTNVNKP